MQNAFDFLFEKILLNELEKESSMDALYTAQLICQNDVVKEFRKILDKIAIQVIFEHFKSEELIQALLCLSRSERIIIIFNIVLGMSLSEVSFLLGSTLNSTRVQKCSALKHLKLNIDKTKF